MSTMDRIHKTIEQHPVMDAVRAFNKHVLNPVMNRVAGRRFWYAAVIRHVGRRSGTTYTTPVVAEHIQGGFIIPLPYGTGTDWVRNIRAAGHATLQLRGETYEVTAPEIIDAATAFPQVLPVRARVWRLLGIQRYLKLTIRADQPA